MSRYFWLACLSLVFATPLFAQSAPTAESVKALLSKFQEEREAALKQGEPADRMKPADEVKAKAEEAAKSEKFAIAAKLVREARWLLPARPLGLPEHVERLIGYTRLRHGDRVNSLVYTPDGEKLISASKDRSVRVWDLTNGRELLSYRGHELKEVAPEKVDTSRVFGIPAVALSPDGATVASSGIGEIHLWELKTGKLKKKLTAHADKVIRGLSFSPDGKLLATGADDRIAKIWNVETGKETVTFPAITGQKIEGLSFTPDGKNLVLVSDTAQLAIHKVDGSDTKNLLTTQPALGMSVGASLALIGDGTTAVVAGKALKVVKNLNLTGGNSAQTTTVTQLEGHTLQINSVAVTKDGKYVVSASNDQSVQVWDVANGKNIRQFPGALSSATAVAIRPDGKEIAFGCESGTIRIADLNTSDEHQASTEAKDAIWSAAFNTDGSLFATAGADRTVRVYQAATGKLEHSLIGHKAAIACVAFLASGELVSGGGDKTIKVWDTKAGKLLRDLTGHGSAVLTLAADGKLLVSGSFDKTVKAWNPADGKVLWTWTSRSAVAALAIRKGGKQLAVGTSDGNLHILDITGSEPKLFGTPQQAHVAGVAGMTYTTDGTRLATVGGDGKLGLWNVAEDGTPTRSSRNETQKPTTGAVALSGVAFSPDGRLVATAGADTTVHIVDTGNGAEVRTLRAHSDWVTTLAFSPNGERLLSVGADKIARLFTLAKSETTAQAGHTAAIRCLSIRSDGTIATGSTDQSVRLWELKSGKELRTLRVHQGLEKDVNGVAFLGQDKIAWGSSEGQLQISTLEPYKLQLNRAYKQIFVVQPGTDGKTLGIWSRESNSDVNTETLELVSTSTEKMPKPIVIKNSKSTCATFSADLKLIAVGDGSGHIQLWDTAKGAELGADWNFHEKRVVDIAITTDGKLLVAVDEDGKFKIADIAKREILHTGTSIGGTLAGIMMAATNDRFAVFNSEGEVRAFDLKGKELRKWNITGGVNAIAFTPDGKRLITANGDNTLAILVLP